MQPKTPGYIQLLLQSIGGIDLTTTSSIKLGMLRNFVKQAEVNVVAFTECNMAWNKVPPHLYPTKQTYYWWENVQLSVCHNHTELYNCTYQPRGTNLAVINKLSYHAQRPGDDMVGLGQSCWACLQGKQNNYLRIISAYWLCKADGPLTTYQQQVHYWSRKGNNSCPKEQE